MPEPAGILARLRRCDAADAFFVELDLPYDRRVLDVARLHILRRMADYLGAAPDSLDEAAATAACRAALARAYADFVASTPLRERGFKVLREAAAPRPAAFVPFDAILDPAAET
jgi:nitrogenase-stabilizing/protective protein